ncbi:MAG: hypothetical protein KGM98_12600 [Bacteroidota bacterium]|nr:hypothetical protein [Bacteroidota bacterium]
MKKIALYVTAVCLSLSLIPLQSLAELPGSPGMPDPKTSTSIETNALLIRLHEIKDMDKSGMTSSEKKVLRKELRSMRREMRSSGRGIYLSVGAVIIIVLLLILLL